MGGPAGLVQRGLQRNPGYLPANRGLFSVSNVAVPVKRAGRRRIRDSLDAGQWRSAAMMATVVLGLHAIGFFLLIAVVVPGHYALGTGTFTIGIGITAYTLGMRHAFDADHIAAIDNTTRKLMAEGKRPLSVGFWFSLGHSTIVFGLAFLISMGIRSLDGSVRHGNSALHQVTSWVGPTVSGAFLYLIAAVNVVILVGILRVFRDMRHGAYDEQSLERQLHQRGLMNRVLGRVNRSVRKPAHMYPVGLLFGLGFDTASEVALLVIAASAGAAGLPWYGVLCLPVLFAAGMSLLDSLDGSFMNLAYGWALARPVRKVFYNLTITSLSVLVAFAVGTIELGGLIGSHLSGSFWSGLAGLNLNLLGFVIVGLFVVTWAVAVAVWRLGKVEQRWTAELREPGSP